MFNRHLRRRLGFVRVELSLRLDITLNHERLVGAGFVDGVDRHVELADQLALLILLTGQVVPALNLVREYESREQSMLESLEGLLTLGDKRLLLIFEV